MWQAHVPVLLCMSASLSANGKAAIVGRACPATGCHCCSKAPSAQTCLVWHHMPPFSGVRRAGGDQATQAAAALKQAGCSDKNLVPKAVTVASIREAVAGQGRVGMWPS